MNVGLENKQVWYELWSSHMLVESFEIAQCLVPQFLCFKIAG